MKDVGRIPIASNTKFHSMHKAIVDVDQNKHNTGDSFSLIIIELPSKKIVINSNDPFHFVYKIRVRKKVENS